MLILPACARRDSHQEMLRLLNRARQAGMKPDNAFNATAKLPYLDSLLSLPHISESQIAQNRYLKANTLLELGREDEAIDLFKSLAQSDYSRDDERIIRGLAIAYLRQAERSNCIKGHEAESCILPIRGLGLHQDTIGANRAIEQFRLLLKENPGDLEARWLLNIAYMTIGRYPSGVPAEYLIPGMDDESAVSVNAFRDIAPGLGIAVSNTGGGAIADDFDNDGYLDLITSSFDLSEPMFFFRNNTNGTFSDWSKFSGLGDMKGGLNMVHADYDNDGDKDILVLRGGWKGKYGGEPNSLLQNQGDGTFRDVTTVSGLLSFHPTQTATWNDFNNDGWLDVFIGNETLGEDRHASELFMSNRDGTFRNVAMETHCEYSLFIKAVASGDYDNDGWIDIFISTMDAQRMLLRNRGLQDGEIKFENVTAQAGLSGDRGSSFPAWFWDYDNDGWLDIFVCDYTFKHSMGYYAAAEKLNMRMGNSNKAFLYHNNHDGTFTNVAEEAGLNKVIFAMGSNFGDIDNDGYLDMYLGTGNPQFQSVIPNKMFKNIDGIKFADVTSAARVGHLQKGHGIAFADMDNDGDQDIYIEMGGAYLGDSYQNSFFLNPGQGDNNWISIELTGTSSNRNAIGSRIKLTFTENGKVRHVYRDVNSGGSFGGSPFRKEIGIGRASKIDEIEIRWHGSDQVQRFRDIASNRFIRITEGVQEVKEVDVKKIQWSVDDPYCLPVF